MDDFDPLAVSRFARRLLHVLTLAEDEVPMPLGDIMDKSGVMDECQRLGGPPLFEFILHLAGVAQRKGWPGTQELLVRLAEDMAEGHFREVPRDG